MKKMWMAVALAVAMSAGAQQVVKLNHLADTVSNPQLVSVSTAPVTVLSTNASRTADRVLTRVVQNMGTAAVLYLINGTNVSTTNYHGVLSGGVTLRDGLGGMLDLSGSPWPVTFVTENGTTTLSVVELRQR